jgi:hypothetical protein
LSEPQPGAAQPQVERRHLRRLKCDFRIEIEWGAAVLQGHVSEMNKDSMFVELDPPLWIGATFAALLALDAPLKLECVVRRVDPRRGMGLGFSSCGSQAVIDLLLESLAKQ